MHNGAAVNFLPDYELFFCRNCSLSNAIYLILQQIWHRNLCITALYTCSFLYFDKPENLNFAKNMGGDCGLLKFHIEKPLCMFIDHLWHNFLDPCMQIHPIMTAKISVSVIVDYSNSTLRSHCVCLLYWLLVFWQNLKCL